MRRAALLAAAMFALAAPAGAAEPRTSLPDVEDEVMCVTCKVPLNIAEAPQAEQERVFIRRLVDQGLTKEQIKDRLVAEYGEAVLALPEENGINLVGYLVPIALVLAMVAGALVTLPRWRRRAPAAATATTGGTSVSEEELARLDADLRRYE